MAGTLFIVATPIGNLEDFTFRALRTLREVDLIAAEDTRRTAKLLAHYQVHKPVISLREHNEAREAPRLVARMTAGETIALVTDAGTPTIADPGARLVRAAHAAGLRVVPIPGPSAVAAALSVSGFSGDHFVFLGFPPASGQSRQRWFDDLANEQRVAVFFEAPHRVRRTLEDLNKSVKRPTVVAREMTKVNENVVNKPINCKMAEINEIGEICIVVDSPHEHSNQNVTDEEVIAVFGRLIDNLEHDEELVIRLISLHLNLPPHRVRNIIKKARIRAKQRA